VVAVPVSMLKKRYISFIPELPQDKQDAIDALEMDYGMKLIIKFSERLWKEDMVFLYLDGDLAALWSQNYRKPDSKYYVLSGPIYGELAKKLGALSKEEMKEFLIKDLSKNLGDKVKECYVDHLVNDWGQEEFIEGAYSFPSLKDADTNCRQRLCTDVAGRVYFAGEYVNWLNFASIGAALESALWAVQAIKKNFELSN